MLMEDQIVTSNSANGLRVSKVAARVGGLEPLRIAATVRPASRVVQPMFQLVGEYPTCSVPALPGFEGL